MVPQEKNIFYEPLILVFIPPTKYTLVSEISYYKNVQYCDLEINMPTVIFPNIVPYI